MSDFSAPKIQQLLDCQDFPLPDLTELFGDCDAAITLGRTGIRNLSERQRAILAWAAAGFSNPEIAARLHFSEKTIIRDLTLLMRSIGVQSRAEASARFAAWLVRELQSDSN